MRVRPSLAREPPDVQGVLALGQADGAAVGGGQRLDEERVEQLGPSSSVVAHDSPSADVNSVGSALAELLLPVDGTEAKRTNWSPTAVQPG